MRDGGFLVIRRPARSAVVTWCVVSLLLGALPGPTSLASASTGRTHHRQVGAALPQSSPAVAVTPQDALAAAAPATPVMSTESVIPSDQATPRRYIPRRTSTASVSRLMTPTAATPAPAVTIGSVAGTFYPNPNNSGAFDTSQLSTPSFNETFPVIDFNPPASAQVACSNSTGVDENTRPFTDVIPKPDGTCSTQVAGQAGVNSLFTFEAVFQTTLTISAPGQVTFNFFSDDGWVLGLGHQTGGSAQPTYSSGSLSDAPPSSAVKGYPVVGAYNQVTAPVQAQVTVNFPAAGTYPTEVDYTECCAGQLALTLGTTAGNPILPGPPGLSCAPTSANASPANFANQLCRIAHDGTLIAQDDAALMGVIGHFPNVTQELGTSTWLYPAFDALSQSDGNTDAAMSAAIELAKDDIGDIIADAAFDKIRDAIQGGAADEDPCVAAFNGLYDSFSDYGSAAQSFTEAAQALTDSQGQVIGTESSDVLVKTAEGQQHLTKAFLELLDALDKMQQCLEQSTAYQTTYNVVLVQIQVIIVVVEQDSNTVSSASQNLAYVPTSGSGILEAPVTGGWTITVQPPELPPSPGSYPPGVSPIGNTITGGFTGTLPMSTSTLTAGSSLNINASNLQVGTPWTAAISSVPVLLGFGTVGPNGTVSATLQIPAQTTPGTHDLELIGTGADGKPEVLGTPITVTQAPGQPPPPCLGTVSGTINHRLIVAPKTTCTLIGARVNGGVIVGPGAVVNVINSTINGGVTLGQGVAFETRGSTINGSITAISPTVFSLDGDRVNGGISLSSPAHSVELCADAVNGGVSIRGSIVAFFLGRAGTVCSPTKVNGSVRPPPAP
jgi:hypothetical protein